MNVYSCMESDDVVYVEESTTKGCDTRYSVHSRIEHQKDKSEKVNGSQTSPVSKSLCFIATAVYGDINAPQVQTLRDFRDNLLMETELGRRLVEFYYSGAGEKTANFIKNKIPSAIPAIRRGLDYLLNNYHKK